MISTVLSETKTFTEVPTRSFIEALPVKREEMKRQILKRNRRNMRNLLGHYTQAIQLNPNDADAYNNRGVAYSGKGDFDRAIDDFDKTIQLNSDPADAYNNRGGCLRQERRF